MVKKKHTKKKGDGRGKNPKSRAALRPWKPGQSGNPLGARLHNQDLRKLRAMTHNELASLGTLVLDNNVDALRMIRDDPESKVLHVWFATIAVKAIENEETGPMNVLLDRIVGKSRERHEITGAGGGPIAAAIMTREEKLIQLEILRKAREKAEDN